MTRRSGRDAAGAFLIEGTRSVADAISGQHPLRQLFVTEDVVGSDLIERATALGADVFTVAPPVMRALSDTTTPQGVVAVADIVVVPLDELPDPLDLVLVVAGVADPGNAGTLLRSAVAAGADAIVFTSGSADPFSPKTVRAAAGALFEIPIVRGGATTETLAALRARGLRTVGADARAEREVSSFDLRGPVALVVGNESWGIDETDALDATVSIEMPGRVESLNVAIAGSILLFETTRQRRATKAHPLSSNADD